MKRGSELSDDQAIGTYLVETRVLNGKVVRERQPWNTVATADAIRHFCDGIGDDHPRWLDPEHAAQAVRGKRTAPPAFLTSVLYPALHGAPVLVPMSSFISEVSFSWFRPVVEGDSLGAACRQIDARAVGSGQGGGPRSVTIVAETTYWNGRGRMVGRAETAMVRIPRTDSGLLVEREIQCYDAVARDGLARLYEAEFERRDRWLGEEEMAEGTELPESVRGPLTTGDMVAWQSAIGPSYRGGALSYFDGLRAPHTMVQNPVTGWPVKYSQQHEDFLLASQRGMPAPFDNGIMRFAVASTYLTNWAGPAGTLARLTVNVLGPNLYGDVTIYRGTIIRKEELPGDTVSLRVSITGTNQLGQVTTTGEADLLVARPGPRRRTVSVPISNRASAPSREPASGLVSIVRRQAAARPDATAIVYRDRVLSFLELEQRVEQRQRELAGALDGRDSVAAVLLERSPEAVISFLALAALGRIWLPIDPDWPSERIASVLDDARVRAVITNDALSARIPSRWAQSVINLDRIIEATTTPAPCADDGGESSAGYLLYTSGSTGRARGVLVPEDVLPPYLDALAESLPVGSDDVFLQTASLAFSASVRQVFLPLRLGATLVIADWEQSRDFRQLLRLMHARRISVWDTVPSVWQAAMNAFSDLGDRRAGEEDGLRALRTNLKLILLTGEPLHWKSVKTWRSRFGAETAIVNLYSQTETGGTVCAYPIPDDCPPVSDEAVVPLGREISGMEVRLLDEAQEAVREGDEGEICVCGDRLATGYCHRETLTAERFLVPVRGPLAGRRLYRSRDRGRRRPDGVLEFAGRMDRQIKWHGHRIDPGEIEAALLSHPDVTEAWVATTANSPSGPVENLAAWVGVREARAPVVDGRRRRRLANDLAIVDFRAHETAFTYHAIFEEQTYLKAGIRIDGLSCIFDVGANIGLFALHAARRSPDAVLHCFEPNPAVLTLLTTNLRLYKVRAVVHPFGLGEAAGRHAFTHLEGSSIQSGLHVDAENEQEVARRLVARQAEAEPDRYREILASIDELLEQRFQARTFPVEVRTLSGVIAGRGIERIDLLKVNAEKSEMAILRGISQEDWTKIDQLVIKVDLEGHREPILDLLRAHGFDAQQEAAPLLRDTAIRTIYARHPRCRDRAARESVAAGRGGTDGATSPWPDLLTREELRRHCGERLPAYAVPNRFLLRDRLPRDTSGKLDRRAMLAEVASPPTVAAPTRQGTPGSQVTKRIRALWRGMLDSDPAGDHESFYDAGGDSLGAAQLLAAIGKDFGVTIPLRRFLEAPTVNGLALLVENYAEADDNPSLDLARRLTDIDAGF